MEAEIDATDQLEVADTQAIQIGLHATLAALENGWSARRARICQRITMPPPPARLKSSRRKHFLTVFIFGPRRTTVRITEFSITEEAFDPALNPIRAKVSLGMTVLTVDDLGFDTKGGGLFMTYLQAKEQLAAQNKAGTLGALGIGGI